MKPQPSENANIAVIETADSYMMRVDLPSLPHLTGAIEGNTHHLTIHGSPSSDDRQIPGDFLTVDTKESKVHTIYQGGALYIVLPKSA